MKKVLSLFLATLMLCSLSTTAFAANSTQVIIVGTGTSEYTLDVPIILEPGEVGTVIFEGTWRQSERFTVEADKTVLMTNEEDNLTELLDISFTPISEIGNSKQAIHVEREIQVEDMDVVFGTWRGIFNYTVTTGSDEESLEHSDVIPVGGTYYVGVSGNGYEPLTLGDYSTASATYTSGDTFPNEVKKGDVYVYGDYEYRYGYTYSMIGSWEEYNNNVEGWGVAVLDSEKSTYSKMLNSINEVNVTHLDYTFANCKNLTSVFGLSNNAISMSSTFENCTSLEVAPVIPEGVTNMGRTFAFCEKLKYVPNIPDSVISMYWTYYWCSELASIPAIPTNVTNIECMLMQCENMKGNLVINASPTDWSGVLISTGITSISGDISESIKNAILAEKAEFDSYQ